MITVLFICSDFTDGTLSVGELNTWHVDRVITMTTYVQVRDSHKYHQTFGEIYILSKIRVSPVC